MKNGLQRFEYYLDQIDGLLKTASNQKNPGLWLYRKNFRTPLFMLEGQAKLYTCLHNKKKFSKIKEQVKLLEDTLGAVDYYDSFAKEFAANKNIPATVTTYLQAQTREKIQSLNEILLENEWLKFPSIRIAKMRKKLREADWTKENKEIEGIHEFYNDSILSITGFVQSSDFHFQNVETDVHELRRKLRWLSIYPQAMRGCIQLSAAKRAPKYLDKYCIKEITESPFNKMPDAAANTHFLLLEQNHFYALSWMIAELGKLKDHGLRLIAIKEALQQTSSISDGDALKKALSFSGKEAIPLGEILVKAQAICKTYFKEKNLEHLVIGTATVI